MSEDNGWIGVDLDRTLAVYDYWRGEDHIGDPIPAMVERIQKWLKSGIKVKVFTARVATAGIAVDFDPDRISAVIQQWCEKHIGVPLPVTCTKDFQMLELWDDRAVQVVPNRGTPALNQSYLGLSDLLA